MTAPDGEGAQLLGRLHRAGIAGADATATLFKGGFKNRVYRVRSGGDRFVAKLYMRAAADDNPYYPNRPELEALALRHLNGTGLAPDPVAWFAEGEDQALLVYRYVEGEPWRDDVALAARLIAAVHAVAPPATMRSVPATPAAILDHGARMLALAGTAGDVAALRPSPVRAEGPARSALLHTDCGPGNIIVSDGRARLIDWQCPAVGDAAEDIACFLSPAMMCLYGRKAHDGPARDAFIATYGSCEATDRYRALAPVFHWRIACYCHYRAVTLAAQEPALASLYREALAAETALLGELRP